jgi:hypothetical protein
MIIDDKKMIISFKERNREKPTQMGNRIGQIITESKKISEKTSVFKRLKKKAIKETIKGDDPLQRILNKV